MIKTGKLFKNIVANSFTMGIMTLFQLISIPVFLKFWKVQLYGEWIALNTLTAYFQMTDVGFNTATKNSFTFYYIKGDKEKCSYLINTNFFFIVFAFSFIFLVLGILIEFDFFINLFQFKLIQNNVVNMCLLFLFLQVFVGTLNNFLNTIYQAVNMYARGIMLDNVIRITEYAVLLLGVILGLALDHILLLGVITKIIGFVVKYIDSQRYYTMRLHIKFLSFKELKEMFIPAVSFFSFPVANSLLFQGLTLLINFFMGSVIVVVYNTSRTLINFIRSIIDILQRSIWPEFSVAYGKDDFAAMRKLHHKALILSMLATLLASFFMLFAGETIYKIWTNNQVPVHMVLFYLFIVGLLLNTLWSTSSVVLLATNNNKSFSLLYFLLAIYVFVFSALALKYTHRIELLPAIIISTDIILILFILKKSFMITEDKFESFIKSIRYEIKHFNFKDFLIR